MYIQSQLTYIQSDLYIFSLTLFAFSPILYSISSYLYSVTSYIYSVSSYLYSVTSFIYSVSSYLIQSSFLYSVSRTLRQDIVQQVLSCSRFRNNKTELRRRQIQKDKNTKNRILNSNKNIVEKTATWKTLEELYSL